MADTSFENHVTKFVVNFKQTDIGHTSDISRSYYNNPTFSDIRVNFSNNTVFSHKLILSAKSKYFCKASTGDSEGAHTRTIHLGNDEDPEVIYMMLHHIYGIETSTWHQTLEETFALAVLVFAAADKYKVPTLCQKMTGVALNNLSVILTRNLITGSVCDSITTVFNHAGDKALKEEMGSVCALYIELVMKSEAFTKMLPKIGELSFRLLKKSLDDNSRAVAAEHPILSRAKHSGGWDNPASISSHAAAYSWNIPTSVTEWLAPHPTSLPASSSNKPHDDEAEVPGTRRSSIIPKPLFNNSTPRAPSLSISSKESHNSSKESNNSNSSSKPDLPAWAHAETHTDVFENHTVDLGLGIRDPDDDEADTASTPPRSFPPKAYRNRCRNKQPLPEWKLTSPVPSVHSSRSASAVEGWTANLNNDSAGESW